MLSQVTCNWRVHLEPPLLFSLWCNVSFLFLLVCSKFLTVYLNRTTRKRKQEQENQHDCRPQPLGPTPFCRQVGPEISDKIAQRHQLPETRQNLRFKALRKTQVPCVSHGFPVRKAFFDKSPGQPLWVGCRRLLNMHLVLSI